MSEGCVPLLRACPAEASAVGRDAAAAITSTGLRAVEQEPDLLCRRDLFFHRLREEAKPAALSFLGTACEGSPSRARPLGGDTRLSCPGGVFSWDASGKSLLLGVGNTGFAVNQSSLLWLEFAFPWGVPLSG